MKQLIISTIVCMLFTSNLLAQEEIFLYKNKATQSNGITEKEIKDDDAFVTNVSVARMYAYIAPNEKVTTPAVLICPGGGYRGLSVKNEGSDMAMWLNKLGVSAFVLYYRMPNHLVEIPLRDAQTALQIIRKNAKKWNINKHKICLAGFSAGGHLASTVGTHFTTQDRPDFMILIYPVISMKNDITHLDSRKNLMGETPSEKMVEKYSNELQVSKKTPPTFIVATLDDKNVQVENSLLFYKALQDENVPVEIHTFDTGGHGFGMLKRGLEVDNWPNLLKEWFKKNKLINIELK